VWSNPPNADCFYGFPLVCCDVAQLAMLNNLGGSQVANNLATGGFAVQEQKCCLCFWLGLPEHDIYLNLMGHSLL
jgi:hypothetical protein